MNFHKPNNTKKIQVERLHLKHNRFSVKATNAFIKNQVTEWY